MYSIVLKRRVKMKAAQINGYGDNVLQTVADAPKPPAGEGQVLVEVAAASVNPFDVKLSQGFYKGISLNMPAVLGGDVAGTVAELGAGVEGFEVGQEVYGMANAAGGQGSLAEFTPVVASQLAPKPKNLGFEDSAALVLTGVSTYQALVDHMNLQPGQKVLIHGGAGGIGSLAIQLAKHLGAYIATTAAASEKEFVTGLGADEVIDYQTQDFSELLQDYDAVYDTVGGETNAKSYKVLKNGGALVSMLEAPNEELVGAKNINYTAQQTKATPGRLNKVAELAEAGVLKPQVDKVFSLDEAAQAFEYYRTGHPKGKIVIKVKG
jgi:NADPH:quinone reductase-like Zn-dependent oxidoreductase